MADRANSTATSEVHDLPPGSAPGDGSPIFEPVAGKPVHTRPRPHPRREVATFQSHSAWLDDAEGHGYNDQTHPEANLIKACGAADELALDEDAAWKAVENIDDETDPLLVRARAASAELRRASAEVAGLQARTPEGLGAKATFLADVLFPQDKVDTIALERIGDHADCLFSFLENARWIASCSRFTLASLVGLEDRAPARAPAEDWGFRHLVQDWARESINNDALSAMFDRLDEVEPMPKPEEALYVRPEDRRLFKIPGTGIRLGKDDRWAYYGEEQMKALSAIDHEDSPNLDATTNRERRRRASEILNAYQRFRFARDQRDRGLGLTTYRQSAYWRNEIEKGLRLRIIDTPARTLDQLLMKTVVFASCRDDDFRTVSSDLEDELIEDNREGAATDDVLAKSLVLDLLRIAVANKMTIHSVAGLFSPDQLPREEVAA